MHFNANAGARHLGPSRKVKRVSDIGAMGPPAQSAPQPAFVSPGGYAPNAYVDSTPAQFNGHSPPPNYGFNPQVNEYNQYPGSQQYTQQSNQFGPGPQIGNHPMQPPQGPQGGMPQFASVFQQPIMQDMAMQYGQQLAQTGKTFVNREIEKYVPVSRLKYYFAVDTRYVCDKLRLLFFPFTHGDWSLKYEQDAPVQPRYDLNAPDLYIPTMAYITYVLLAGLILGMQNRFSPEQIGIQASSALAYTVFEIVVYSATLYITSIQTTLKTLDLLAYSGYKYVSIIACLLVSLAFKKSGYYIALIYTSITLAFFMVRTLKALVLQAPPADPSIYGSQNMGYGAPPVDIGGNKRRLYFLLFVAATQPFLIWWLSFHLLPLVVPETTAGLGL